MSVRCEWVILCESAERDSLGYLVANRIYQGFPTATVPFKLPLSRIALITRIHAGAFQKITITVEVHGPNGSKQQFGTAEEVTFNKSGFGDVDFHFVSGVAFTAFGDYEFVVFVDGNRVGSTTAPVYDRPAVMH